MSKETERKYEGPARLLTAGIDEASVNSGRGMPGGVSPAERYTKRYGERGVGWGFETDQYASANELKDALHAPEFTIATEGMRNLLFRGSYQTDDGQDLSGKVQRYTREPDMGNVVVYPDGDHYSSEKPEQDNSDA